MVSAVAQPLGLFVMWSAWPHSSHSVNGKEMARFARFIERETEIFVEDKDAENTGKVSESINKCSRITSRKRKLQNPNKRLC